MLPEALSTTKGLALGCENAFIVHLSSKDATLAQLVEQLIRNEQVVGSNPMGGSIFYQRRAQAKRCRL